MNLLLYPFLSQESCSLGDNLLIAFIMGRWPEINSILFGGRGGGASLHPIVYIAAGAISCLVVYRSLSRSLGGSDPKMSASDQHIVQLLPAEVAECMMFPAITSITFFEGEIDESELRDKVSLILAANPWLIGRLVKRSRAEGITLSVPLEGSDAFARRSAEAVQIVQDASLGPGVQYADLFDKLEKYTVKPGPKCLNQEGEPLFKVALVQIDPGARSALLVSLSHVIADGYTFYKVGAGTRYAYTYALALFLRVVGMSGECDSSLSLTLVNCMRACAQFCSYCACVATLVLICVGAGKVRRLLPLSV